MLENTMLYFRSVADEDNDDGAESAATNLTSLLIPASRLRWMNPTSDTLLTLIVLKTLKEQIIKQMKLLLRIM